MKATIKALCLFLAAMLLFLAGCGAKSDGTIEVQFYLNDETEDMFTSIKGTAGSNVFLPGGTPERSGYIFNGWFLDEEGAEAYTGTADENLSVYAGWAPPVEVAFSGEGVVMMPVEVVAKGALVTAPEEPLREGYTFSGWFADEMLTVPWNFEADKAENDMTLYAGWSGMERVITLHLGNGMTEPLIVAGPLIGTPEAPYREGYSFGGWYLDEAASFPFDIMNDTATGDMNLYAKWIELAPGETPAPTPEPTKKPSSSSSSSSSRPTATPKPTATPPPSTTGFTVTFDAGGGTAVSSYANVPNGSTITKPYDPTRSGYTFSGWYREPTLSTAWNFSSDRVTANITLYARWTSGNNLTVSFDSNGGSSVSAYSNVMYGTRISAPTNPTKSGFRFVRWCKESTLTTAWDFANDIVVQNTTLYAMWEVAGDVTVRCDPNYGGFEPWSRTVKAGESVTLPNPTSRSDGYTFLGWYTASTGGSLIGGGGTTYTPEASITLYAKWEAPPAPPPVASPT